MKTAPQQETDQADALSDEIIEMFDSFVAATEDGFWSRFHNCRFCCHSILFGTERYCMLHDEIIFDPADPCNQFNN